MDKILAESASLTPALLTHDEETYDKTANSLVVRLSNYILGQPVKKETLDALHPATDTIAYLFTVAAAIKNAASNGKASVGLLPRALLPEGDLWPYITNILLNFDLIQVRYAGQSLAEIIQVVGQGAEHTQNYIPAIQLLSNVILRLDSTSSTFTSTHHTYVRLCLLSSAYADALVVISNPIYHIPATDKNVETRSGKYKCSAQESSAGWLTQSSGLTQKVTTRMFLEYNSMCALCYIALGQYQQAISFLEVILIAPTVSGVASLIAVDAYKKWTLLNLLVNGSVPEYPRPAFQATVRNIQSLGKPYDCVAEAFKQRDPSRLMAEIHEGSQVWQDDLTIGLIQEVFQAHRKFTVLGTGKIFTAIPVSRLESQLPADQNGTSISVYLQSLISSGELQATLAPTVDGSDQILRFLPQVVSKKPERQIEQELESRSQQLHALLRHIGELDHRMHLGKEYVDMLKKLKKNRDDDNKKRGTGGRASKDTSGLVDVDEDMMADEF